VTLSGMLSMFERAKRKYGSGVVAYTPPEILRVVEDLEKAAIDAVYVENESGGHARQVVASVARVLDVDIDEGTGHRWDPEHMARVVDGARELKAQAAKFVEERDRWQREAERLKREDDERQKARLGPVIWHTSTAEEHTFKLDDDPLNVKRVKELESVIVSQAREIARLKGESE
jgi:hypothetical protein